MQILGLLINIQNKKDIALNLNANNLINQCRIAIHQIEDPMYLERINSFEISVEHKFLTSVKSWIKITQIH